MKTIFALTTWYFAAIGWGRLLAFLVTSKGQRFKHEAGQYHFLSLLGLPALFIFTSTYHWFAPISVNFCRAVLLVGIVSFGHLIARSYKELKLQDLLIFGVSLIAGLHLQGTMIVDFDSMLYHTPLILWSQSDPVVFGLGNLHGRFGFNSAYLTILSTLYFPSLGIRAIYLGQAFFFMLYISFILKKMSSTSTTHLKLFFFITSTLFCLLAVRQISERLSSSTSTDAAATLLVILASLLYVGLISNPSDPISNNSKETGLEIELFTMCTISVLAVLTKLSALPVIIFLFIFIKNWKESPCLPRVSFKIGSCSVLMLFLWIMQNFVMSGCLIYPVRFTCTSAVEWAVNTAAIQDESNSITAWARRPGPQYLSSLGNFDWIPEWFARQHVFLMVVLGFSACVIIAATILRFYSTGRRNLSSKMSDSKGINILFWIPSLVCILSFSFASVGAPDPRFVFGFFVVLPASLGLLLLSQGNINKSTTSTASTMKGVSIAIVITLLVFWALRTPAKTNNLEVEFADARLLPETTTKKTQSGIIIKLAPPETQSCGIAPPPCTYTFLDTLNRGSFFWLPMWKVQK
jgi:hypothetical protein